MGKGGSNVAISQSSDRECQILTIEVLGESVYQVSRWDTKIQGLCNLRD